MGVIYRLFIGRMEKVMANVTERGIVIKRSDYGDNNCILKLFTRESGIISAVIYGIKRGKNNGKAASGQFLCYGDYELYFGKGNMASVDNVDIIDAFLAVSNDIAKLALSAYMAETVMTYLGENNPDERLYGIFLNCIYALAHRDDSIDKIKSVFELKLMCAEGLSPMLNRCACCGSNEIEAFDAEAGGMVCRSCMKGSSVKISAAVYKALYFLVYGEDKKMLSFSGNDILLRELGKISESYLLKQSDREFKTLGYFKAMRNV